MRLRFTTVTLPRHPLARGALALAGLALLALMSVVGLAIAGIVTAAWLLRRAWRSLRGPQASTGTATPPGVIEGEYTVVAPQRLPRG